MIGREAAGDFESVHCLLVGLIARTTRTMTPESSAEVGECRDGDRESVDSGDLVGTSRSWTLCRGRELLRGKRSKAERVGGI